MYFERNTVFSRPWPTPPNKPIGSDSRTYVCVCNSPFLGSTTLSVAFLLCGAAKQQRGVDSRGSCSTACQQSGVRVIRKIHVTLTTSYLQDRGHAPFRVPGSVHVHRSTRTTERGLAERMVFRFSFFLSFFFFSFFSLRFLKSVVSNVLYTRALNASRPRDANEKWSGHA